MPKSLKNLKPVAPPQFLVPADLPPVSFVEPNEERRRDGVQSTNVIRMSNFGLLITRYVPHQAIRNSDDDRIVEVKVDKKTGNTRDSTYLQLRSLWFEHLPNNFTQANREVSATVDATHQRWMAMTEGAARFKMFTRSRLIVGLGGKGALEFGITLHPVTGLPYIPGSALKGLCRSYTLYYIAEQSGISLDPAKLESPSEAARQLDEQLCGVKNHGLKLNPEWATFYQNLFGTQGESGHCVFYDAIVREIPSNASLFAVEVMTPHFRSYYESNGKEAPDDADDPNPITYIAVNMGIPFRFAVGLRKNAPLETPLGDARTLLKTALMTYGIGAKTAAGYGVFREPS